MPRSAPRERPRGQRQRQRIDLREWRQGSGHVLGVDIPQPRDGHLSVAVPPGVGGESVEPETVSTRVWTVPNIISLARIAVIPVFVLCLVAWDAPAKALIVLAVLGASDWVDGKIARLWDQRSKLGAKLDPIADRILIAVVPLVFAIVGYVPWWAVIVLLVRDAILVATLPIYQRKHLLPEVIYLGKAAAFALMWSFPLLLAAEAKLPAHDWLRLIGEASLYWGVGLYVWSGLVYVGRAVQVARLP